MEPFVKKTSKKLPPTSLKFEEPWYSVYGMGYEEPDDDYKVVRIRHLNYSNATGEIYSSKNDSWKRVADFKGGIESRASALYANGKFHFHGYYKNIGGAYWTIVSLDVEGEAYGTIEYPEVELPKFNDRRSGISIGLLKGRIAALYNYPMDRADVWVLKEYGVKESWTKLVVIPYVRNYVFWYRICIIRNGKYLLARGDQLVVYDPEGNSFACPRNGDIDPISWTDIYVESLVPIPTREIKGGPK